MSSFPNLIPIIEPKWKRVFHTEDISPTASNQSNDSLLKSPTSSKTCPTCMEKEARYTCPKCSAPYCSVGCYRRHSVPANGEGNVGICAEVFYRDKVIQSNKMEQQSEDNKSQMLQILSRQSDSRYQHQNEGHSDDDFTDDDIIELAKCIDTTAIDHNSCHETDDGLSDLPERLRLKFESSVRMGRLSYLVEQWSPFWIPHYLTTVKDKQKISEQQVTDVSTDGDSHIPSLDERIIQIQPISELRRQSDKDECELQFNTCDLLYSTAYMLRLYNGVIDHDEAAMLLLQYSAVLQSDARFTSIEEVLMSRSATTIEKSDTNASLNMNTLMNDLACLVQHKRLVLRCLFSALDAVKEGIRHEKKSSRQGRHLSKSDMRNDQRVNDGKGTTNSVRSYQLAKRKLKYYISWCASFWTSTIERALHDAILHWIEDWALTSCKPCEEN